ncbi:MAG: hypothetical protein JXO22_13420 [Phycisphaerae bacterium]|nr:hypothetical protein [Phycisphaerae bacterium]
MQRRRFAELAEWAVREVEQAGIPNHLLYVQLSDVLDRAREAELSTSDVVMLHLPPDALAKMAERQTVRGKLCAMEADSASAAPTHNADFTMVNWYGTEYHFALGVQSSAVQALWAEWEKTGLGLHQDTIRDAVDAERDTFRMDKAFRNHPAFGTMIQAAGDGRYRLVPPDEQSSRRNEKA